MKTFRGLFFKVNTVDTTRKFLDHEVDALQGGGGNIKPFVLYPGIRVEPSYNNISLCDTSFIMSDIL
jgi:hypothetical protein